MLPSSHQNDCSHKLQIVFECHRHMISNMMTIDQLTILDMAAHHTIYCLLVFDFEYTDQHDCSHKLQFLFVYHCYMTSSMMTTDQQTTLGMVVHHTN